MTPRVLATLRTPSRLNRSHGRSARSDNVEMVKSRNCGQCIPPANEVVGKVMFSQAWGCIHLGCIHEGGGGAHPGRGASGGGVHPSGLQMDAPPTEVCTPCWKYAPPRSMHPKKTDGQHASGAHPTGIHTC